MRMNGRQRLLMNLVETALELEEAEEQVEVLPSFSNKLKMSEAYSRYREYEAKAIKDFNDIEELERAVAVGVMFMKILKSS